MLVYLWIHFCPIFRWDLFAAFLFHSSAKRFLPWPFFPSYKAGALQTSHHWQILASVCFHRSAWVLHQRCRVKHRQEGRPSLTIQRSQKRLCSVTENEEHVLMTALSWCDCQLGKGLTNFCPYFDRVIKQEYNACTFCRVVSFLEWGWMKCHQIIKERQHGIRVDRNTRRLQNKDRIVLAMHDVVLVLPKRLRKARSWIRAFSSVNSDFIRSLWSLQIKTIAKKKMNFKEIQQLVPLICKQFFSDRNDNRWHRPWFDISKISFGRDGSESRYVFSLSRSYGES